MDKACRKKRNSWETSTWVTDIEFLKHFGLSSIKDLPKVDELESIIM